MIVVKRSAPIAPGKKTEAVELWTRFATCLNKLNPSGKYTVMTSLTGEQPNWITMLSWHDSVAAWDKDLQEHRANPDFQALWKENKEKGYTVAENLVRNLYEVAD